MWQDRPQARGSEEQAWWAGERPGVRRVRGRQGPASSNLAGRGGAGGFVLTRLNPHLQRALWLLEGRRGGYHGSLARGFQTKGV